MFIVRITFFLLISFFFTNHVLSQVTDSTTSDSLPKRDTARSRDSAITRVVRVQPVAVEKDTVQDQPIFRDTKIPFYEAEHLSPRAFTAHLLRKLYTEHPYFAFSIAPTRIVSNRKEFEGKEALFYSVIGFLLVFAFLRNSFPKYLSDLYSLFFRTTLKQRQIREQLLQTPLASLLLNIFYFLAGGYYVSVLLEYYKMNPVDSMWLLFVYATTALAAIYSVKFLTLKFTGWLFNIREAMDSYIFIVFLVNKIIGIWLVPFIVLLAFTEGSFHKISLTLSWLGIAGFFVYRFILTFGAVRNQIKVNPFHFFIYLLAFEIVPLLLIYKLLLLIF